MPTSREKKELFLRESKKIYKELYDSIISIGAPESPSLIIVGSSGDLLSYHVGMLLAKLCNRFEMDFMLPCSFKQMLQSEERISKGEKQKGLDCLIEFLKKEGVEYKCSLSHAEVAHAPITPTTTLREFAMNTSAQAQSILGQSELTANNIRRVLASRSVICMIPFSHMLAVKNELGDLSGISIKEIFISPQEIEHEVEATPFPFAPPLPDTSAAPAGVEMFAREERLSEMMSSILLSSLGDFKAKINRLEKQVLDIAARHRGEGGAPLGRDVRQRIKESWFNAAKMVEMRRYPYEAESLLKFEVDELRAAMKDLSRKDKLDWIEISACAANISALEPRLGVHLQNEGNVPIVSSGIAAERVHISSEFLHAIDIGALVELRNLLRSAPVRRVSLDINEIDSIDGMILFKLSYIFDALNSSERFVDLYFREDSSLPDSLRVDIGISLSTPIPTSELVTWVKDAELDSIHDCYGIKPLDMLHALENMEDDIESLPEARESLKQKLLSIKIDIYSERLHQRRAAPLRLKDVIEGLTITYEGKRLAYELAEIGIRVLSCDDEEYYAGDDVEIDESRQSALSSLASYPCSTALAFDRHITRGLGEGLDLGADSSRPDSSFEGEILSSLDLSGLPEPSRLVVRAELEAGRSVLKGNKLP